MDTLAKKSIYLRREFHVAKKVKDATAYVCGLGFYEFSLNGEKVGDSEFAPLWSDYDKSVYYNTYDVTSQVKKGGNAIGVLLGNGFYNVQGGRYRKLQISFGAPTLRFRMVVNYEDGTSETIVPERTGSTISVPYCSIASMAEKIMTPAVSRKAGTCSVLKSRIGILS